jgi:hypothetical protein
MTTPDLLLELAKLLWPLTLGAGLAILWVGWVLLKWMYKTGRKVYGRIREYAATHQRQNRTD